MALSPPMAHGLWASHAPCARPVAGSMTKAPPAPHLPLQPVVPVVLLYVAVLAVLPHQDLAPAQLHPVQRLHCLHCLAAARGQAYQWRVRSLFA